MTGADGLKRNFANKNDLQIGQRVISDLLRQSNLVRM